MFKVDKDKWWNLCRRNWRCLKWYIRWEQIMIAADKHFDNLKRQLMSFYDNGGILFYVCKIDWKILFDDLIRNTLFCWIVKVISQDWWFFMLIWTLNICELKQPLMKFVRIRIMKEALKKVIVIVKVVGKA